MKKRNQKVKVLNVVAPIALAAMAMMPFAKGNQDIVNPASLLKANGGYASPAYDSNEDAKQAAEDINIQLTGEGSVLLKNDNSALPLKKATEKVTVFGTAASALQGGTGNVRTALADDSFTVNETILTESDFSNAETETAADGKVGEFKDVAVVVLKRGGGEGSDLSVKTSELAADATENDGWTHKALAKDGEGNVYKHNQMLTASEIKMIDFAKKKCSKVVVLLNTSNAMEMYNLQQDKDIDSIMFIGRPGQNGIKAVPKLLSGEMNPSGKLVDTWDKDFTANPTWYNSIANV